MLSCSLQKGSNKKIIHLTLFCFFNYPTCRNLLLAVVNLRALATTRKIVRLHLSYNKRTFLPFSHRARVKNSYKTKSYLSARPLLTSHSNSFKRVVCSPWLMPLPNSRNGCNMRPLQSVLSHFLL